MRNNFIFLLLIVLFLSCEQEVVEVQVDDLNSGITFRSEVSYYEPINDDDFTRLIEDGESEEAFDQKLELFSFGVHQFIQTTPGSFFDELFYSNTPCEGEITWDNLNDVLRTASFEELTEASMEEEVNAGIRMLIADGDQERNYAEEILSSLEYEGNSYTVVVKMSNFEHHLEEWNGEEALEHLVAPGIGFRTEHGLYIHTWDPGREEPSYFPSYREEVFANPTYIITTTNINDAQDAPDWINDPCYYANGNNPIYIGGSSNYTGSILVDEGGSLYRVGPGFGYSQGHFPLDDDFRSVRISEYSLEKSYEGGVFSGNIELSYKAIIYNELDPTSFRFWSWFNAGWFGSQRNLIEKVETARVGGGWFNTPTDNDRDVLIDTWGSTYDRMWLLIYEHDAWPYGMKEIENPNCGPCFLKFRAKFASDYFYSNHDISDQANPNDINWGKFDTNTSLEVQGKAGAFKFETF